MRAWLLLVLLFLLAACASQPTALLPTATSTPAPTHTPTLTPSPTLIPTPTPLPHPAAFDEAFDRGLIRYDATTGQWRVTAVQSVDGGRQTIELVLLPDSFDTHDDLRAHNPLAPYTVRAISPLPVGEGPGVREVTLLWNAEKAEFRLAYTFPPLFEGVGTENPRLIKENLDQIPFIPIEDIQSGLAAQSLLAHILERMDKGESLADILYMDPDAVRQNWQNLGGNSLLFELRPDGKVAWLKAKGNDQSAQDFRYNNATMKALPFGANIEINGQNYFAFYIANFDPIDPQNPDPNNLSNWKFFLSIPTYAGNPVDIQDPIVNWKDAFRKNNPLTVYALLYGDEKYQQNHPLLSQLLSIEGNDIRQYENPVTPGINFSYWIDWGLTEITRNGTGVAEIYDPNNPNFMIDEIQTMGPFPVEMGVAQSNP